MYIYRNARIIRSFLVGLVLPILMVSELYSNGPGKAPDVWNVPAEKQNYWIRQKESHKLREYLDKHHQGLIAITGISGVGKSEFCIHYLNHHYKDYDVIWWIDASRDIGSQFQELALDWNLAFRAHEDQIPLDKLVDAGVVRFVKETLRKTNKRWVLIFDGAVSLESIRPFIPTIHEEQSHRKHVIITSQNQLDWPEQIKLYEFSIEEATSFTQSILEEEPQEIQKLFEITSRLPFYLASALRKIKESHMKIREFVVKEESSTTDEKMGQTSVLKVFEGCRNDLADIQSDNPAAYGVLLLLSVKQNLTLPRPILDAFISKEFPKSNVTDALYVLQGKSLVNEVTVANDGVTSFFVHDIIQKAVSEDISEKKSLDFINKLTAILVSYLDLPWEEMVSYTSRNPQVVALAHQLWELGKDKKLVSVEYFRLGLALMEYHMFKTREHPQYESIFSHLKHLQEQLGSARVPKEVLHRFYIDIVYIRSIYEDSTLAAEVEKNLLSAIRGLKNSDDKDFYLRALTNGAQFFFFRGNLEKAKQFFAQGEKIQDEAKSISNRNLYWYIRSWAHFEAGEYAECDRCLDLIFEKFDHETNRAIKMYVMNMKANSCLATERLDESVTWCRKSLEESADYFQNESSELTAEALMILGKGQIRQKNYTEAKKNLSKSLAIYETYFGPDLHPDQAIALRSMGEICLLEGKNNEALSYLTRAMNLYTKQYGEDFKNMNEVSASLVGLAVLGVKMGNEELAQKYLHLHIKNFGADHQGTKAIFDALDKK